VKIDSEDDFEFPTSSKLPTVVTNFMRVTRDRIVKLQPFGLGATMSGRSRLGKTTTAEWIVESINAKYTPENPRAFRAFHYQVGKISGRFANDEKRGIKSVWSGALEEALDEGRYRRLLPESLAEELVHGLRRRRIALGFIDEAGLLSSGAIRGMIGTVRDKSLKMGWPLTLVFVGMDELPQKLDEVPQVRERVTCWIPFTEYERRDTVRLLRGIHPHFANASKENPDVREQMLFIHNTIGGYPGKIVSFLSAVDTWLPTLGGEYTLEAFKAVHKLVRLDREKLLREARANYRVAKETTAAPSGDAAENSNRAKAPKDDAEQRTNEAA
jgi:hypothetical protein